MRKSVADFLVGQILNPHAFPRLDAAHHLIDVGKNQLALSVRVRRVDQPVRFVKKLFGILITACGIRFYLQLEGIGNTGINAQIPLLKLSTVSDRIFELYQVSLTVNDHGVFSVKRKLPVTDTLILWIFNPFSCS